MLKKIMLGALCALWVGAAQAHIKLSASLPAEGAQLANAPTQLQLDYSGEVRPVRITLKDQSGRALDFGFKPSTKAAASFSWALPQVVPGNYEVRWIVIGGDGHKMKGQFSFTVADN
ncbi:MAG: copper resistance CopC family protein [Pseudomonadales bacterium]